MDPYRILLGLLIVFLAFTGMVCSSLNNSVLFIRIHEDRYVIDLSLALNEGRYSVLLVGEVYGNKTLRADIRFYTTSLNKLLSVNDKVSFTNLSLTIDKYSRFSMYKVNGSTNLLINDKSLQLILNADILVSNNSSLRRVEVKATLIPISSDKQLVLLALTLTEDLLKWFFKTIENMSGEFIKTRSIVIERIPTTIGVGIRVKALLDVIDSIEAWRNIATSIVGIDVASYIKRIFDNRIRDYAIGLFLTRENDTFSGRTSIVFDKGFSELLGLNYTLLGSGFTFTYYESPGKTVFNISGLVLKPVDDLPASLGETGSLLYQLIGNTSMTVKILPVNVGVSVSRVPLEPNNITRDYIEWNSSEILLYLGQLVVEEKNSSNSYLIIVFVMLALGFSLFYIVRRVSSK